MPTADNHDWQAVRLRGHGLQPHLANEYNCLPAWDVNAICPEPDEYIPYPAAAEPPDDHPFFESGMPVFRDRHIDKRFHLEYPRVAKDTPRTISKTIGDADREWDILIEHRDRFLAAAGLSLESPAEDVARCLADAFKWASPFYHNKPNGALIDGQRTRQLHHPIEALLHQCYCVGCAHALVALADACGLAARNVGMHGHHAAEVRIDGQWRFVENSCRHERSVGLEALFPASWMELTLHPERFADCMPPAKAGGYWGADNGDYCLMGGSWRSPLQLLFAADCAYALYPELEHWGFKGLRDGCCMPLVSRLQGFIWMDEVDGGQTEERREMRRRTAPFPMAEPAAHRTFVYHPFGPGDRLRQSFWLDALDGLRHVEVVIPLAPETHLQFDQRLGSQLALRLGDWGGPLAALGQWPPPLDETSGHRHCTVAVPVEALRADAVNWLELQNRSAVVMQHPFTPAAMAPYIAPLHVASATPDDGQDKET